MSGSSGARLPKVQGARGDRRRTDSLAWPRRPFRLEGRHLPEQDPGRWRALRNVGLRYELLRLMSVSSNIQRGCPLMLDQETKIDQRLGTAFAGTKVRVMVGEDSGGPCVESGLDAGEDVARVDGWGEGGGDWAARG